MKLLLFFLGLICTVLGVVDYTNYAHVRIDVPNKAIAQELLPKLRQPGVILLKDPRNGKPIHILVPPDQIRSILNLMKTKSIKFKILSKNIQKAIDAEKKTIIKSKFKDGDDPSKFDLTSYHNHDDINAFLVAVSTTYPEITELLTIGTTYEGRKMLALKIGKPAPSADDKKNGLWIDAGIHAREWIAPATALYIISKLTVKYDTDSDVKDLVDNLDWYILPSGNPDGYEYSINSDRMWRKTRTKHCTGSSWWGNNCCYGVDPNRNFPFQYNAADGASTDVCDETYKGPNALSEPCTAAMAKWLYQLNDTVQAMLTLHSYSEDWLVPYGYIDPPDYPSDYKELLSAAQDGAEALFQVHGTQYTVGNSAGLLYPASGASDDFSKSIGIKYVYTIELRPGDDSGDGFQLPADQIMETGQETFAGVRVIAERVLALKQKS